jgi:general secretion pathway protein M
MRSLTSRLAIGRRQILAVVAYGGIVIGLFAIALLLVADLRDRLAEVAAAQMRLDQLSGRSPPSSESMASNASVSGSPFLEGQTVTIAGAALQQRVETAVEKAGGALISSQVELDGPDAKNGFVGLTASVEVDQAAVQAILYDVEAGMPYLFVDKVSIQSPEVFGEPESGRMRMTIGVAGQWRSSD